MQAPVRLRHLNCFAPGMSLALPTEAGNRRFEPGAPPLHQASVTTPDPSGISDLLISETFVRADQPRRVLVYAPLAYSTPHFETDLEIAQRHLDLGDQVELMLCDGDLPSCQLNPCHELRRCVQCVSRNLQGAAQLSAKVPVLGLTAALAPEDHARLAQLPRHFADQQALRRYCFEGFDAGMATLSSLIDFVQSVTIDTQQHRELIHRMLYSAVLTYLALQRQLRAKPYDRVYIYNGRWSMVRSAVRACASVGVPYYTHERGASFKQFALFRNVLPHDMRDFQARTRAAWEQAREHPAARAIAAAFFQERRQRVEKSWFSFVKQQDAGRLPGDWERPARRLVFFTSSEFEFAAIADEIDGRIYSGQAVATGRIARRLARADPAAHLWVRVHPNDKNPATAQRWRAATSGLANVTLILAEEKIDSYALLDGAARVLTFGSTTGLEATYWGKPVVCADRSFYDGLDAQYEARTEDELIDLLTRPHLPPKPRECALPFGYYLNTAGAPFLHFATEEISDYEFKSPFRGRCLKPDYDDLRQRLLALYHEGDDRRVASVARLCAAFNPGDELAQALRVLSLLRLNALELAIAALEEASSQAPPPQMESVLKNTAQALVDALQLAGDKQAAVFPALASRAGHLLRRSPVFAPIGQKLVALANHAAAHAHPARPAQPALS